MFARFPLPEGEIGSSTHYDCARFVQTFEMMCIASEVMLGDVLGKNK